MQRAANPAAKRGASQKDPRERANTPLNLLSFRDRFHFRRGYPTIVKIIAISAHFLRRMRLLKECKYQLAKLDAQVTYIARLLG